MTNQTANRSLSFKSDFRPLLKLAIPLIITGVIQSSVNFIETIFLARLGEQILAAGALVAWLFFTLVVLFFGIFNSINVLVAHQYGAKDYPSIALVLRDGFLLGLLLTVPIFFLLRNMAPIFLWFGQKTALVESASLYLNALSWGILAKFILFVLFEFVIGLGHTRVSMVFTIITIPLYLLFSYLLIFGKFGFPNLGIAGAGWGMTIGDWICVVFFGTYLLLHKDYRHYLKSMFTLNGKSYLWEMIELGVPMGLMFSIEVGFFFAMSLLMGLISIESLAANQITMQYLGPLMGIIFCIAQAITVQMGHQLGAQQVTTAERTAYAGVLLSVIFMIFVAIIYWTCPAFLISVDFNLNDPQNFNTIQTAKQFLFIAAFFQIFEAMRIAFFGALRGLKDTKFTLFISILSFWGIGLAVGYFLAHFIGLGAKGFWLAMVLGAMISVTLLYHRFKFKIRYLRKH